MMKKLLGLLFVLKKDLPITHSIISFLKNLKNANLENREIKLVIGSGKTSNEYFFLIRHPMAPLKIS